jgi:hypothetical protein
MPKLWQKIKQFIFAKILFIFKKKKKKKKKKKERKKKKKKKKRKKERKKLERAYTSSLTAHLKALEQKRGKFTQKK